MHTSSFLPLAPAHPHRNQQLFSDYYLDHILPQRRDWQALLPVAAPVMQQLTAIYQAYTPSGNEAQTEDGLIKPVLHALGHTFEVQAALTTPDGTKRPDYIFYNDLAALNAHKNQVLNDTLLQAGGLAIGDAKHWDRPLDVTLKTGGDFFSNKHPGYQIAFYIQHSGLAWGILTNGRLWRLYHRDTAHKLDRYYEIDLPDLLDSGSVESFLYVYAFFHRSAFAEHPLGVAALLKASSDYAQGVGDTLKKQVYDALRHLAQGFLDYGPNRLASDPATLKLIYDHALIVLYRLLFILYAEARELLPVRTNESYRRHYSLYAIVREIERVLHSGAPLLADSTTFWPRLQNLFRIINAGSPPLHVATFNGGLFDPARHPFLEAHTVGDARLLHALDMLARVGGQYIDYRDLAERHLGTIYEGLLEYHLEAIPREDEWTVALLNDKGERKVTGSYYTPDYIVKYIVDQTVGPILRQAVQHKTTDAAKVQAVLAVNVLDPAMGSGHFLVETTEYIARFLVDLAVTPDNNSGGEADLAYWKRRVVQSCIYGVDLNPLAVDLARLSLWLVTVARDKPLSFLDHHLRCGNALVGAWMHDLNVRSTTPTRKKRKQPAPAAGQVSMLDDEAFRQSMSSAVDSMWLIERTAGNTIDEVKEQERVYATLQASLTRKYGRLANLVTAGSFGLEIDPAFWNTLADYASGRVMTAPPRLVEWLDSASRLAESMHFFHWELEFPEVFFDKHGYPLADTAGFDAVVGNPPYVRQEQLGPFKSYFAQAFAQTYHGVADLYVYFYQQGLHLLQQGGRMSYIVTNKWLRAGYGEALRGYFATHAAIHQLIDFGHAPIFADADVFPCIVVLEKTGQAVESQQLAGDAAPAEHQVHVTTFPREALRLIQLDSYVRRYGHYVPQSRFGRAAWSLEQSDVDRLINKIRQVGVPLAEFAGVKPYYGIKTGLNEAFLIDTATRDRLVHTDPRCAEIIKPYLRGQDIKRWSPEWAGLWLILLKSSGDYTWPWSETPDAAESIFQTMFPSLYAHLKPLEHKLRKRQDKGRYWWELRTCSYYAAFDKPKLMYQEIQFHSWFLRDDQGYFSNNKTFLLTNPDATLLAILNSPLMWWHNWRYLPHMKDEALSPVTVLMETLPIAPPTDAIRAAVAPLVERLIAITRANQETVYDTLDWLQTEFALEKAGQRLADFAALDPDTFVAEVRKRRPRVAGPLSPAALKALRTGYTEQALPMQQRQQEARQLEYRLADLVNAAYGLTPDDVDLLWRTAPPRMPVGRRRET